MPHQWEETYREDVDVPYDGDARGSWITEVVYTCAACGQETRHVAGEMLPPEFYSAPCEGSGIEGAK